jgi:protein-S-isoprenylcysteine O-methyltransferase Ste14
MSLGRHALAIGLLPVVVTLVVPAAILLRDRPVEVRWALALPGGVLIAAGLALVVWTIALFGTVGKGTLAPWDPTSRLVVRGPYQHVRNPMISGVLGILLGEAVLLGSVPLLVWFGLVLAVNAVYMPLVEEPGLRRRFGEDYETYKANVPRWVPRLRPWP